MSIIGNAKRVKVTFKDLVGAVADPTTTTLKVRTPAGVETSYVYGSSAIVRVSAGIFYYDLALTEAGVYRVRWIGTGAVTAAQEAEITARASAFTAP